MPLLTVSTVLDRRPAPAPAPRPVRPAVRADIPRLLELLRLQHDEAPIAKVNWDKVRRLLESVLLVPGAKDADGNERSPAGAIGVAIEDGKVVGCVGLVFTSLWWTDDLHLDERFFFVHPAHRKSRHAQRLIDWCKVAQKTVTIPLVSCVFSTKHTERKIAFFKRSYPMVGAIFRYTGD